MKEKLKQQDEFRWWLDKSARERMKVSAKIIGSRKIIDALEDAAVEQLTNVATLPGAVEPVLAMPDAHWGYGLPMGAVGAFDAEEGIISAGCTGFDINCGVRLLRTNLTLDALKPKLRQLMDELFRRVPAGVGSKGKLRLSDGQFNDVVRLGARWAIENDHGIEADLTHCEETGGMEGAATKAPRITEKARRRGRPQLGTLGAGNHYLEVQKVEKIFDENAAKTFGLESGQIVVMLHCGSRGFGHQVATDYLERMATAVKKYNIWLPDKQLVCAPASSPEGQDYYAAMKAAVNFAFCNRQVMTHWIREGFEAVFSKDWEKIGLNLVYDVTHNICKFETHEMNGTKRDLYVHRKGATRAFGPGNPLIPEAYRSVGQPVLIGGSMGTGSYILAGTKASESQAFSSACHGAGRSMSRHKAMRQWRGRQLIDDLEVQGIIIRSPSLRGVAEEAPGAYKDVSAVVNAADNANLARKVARLLPMAVIKG